MKTIFLYLTLLLLSFSGFAQTVDQGAYDDLIKKSRRARTTSIILVSTGPVIAVGGVGTLIYGLVQREDGFGDYYYDINGNYVQGAEKKYTTEIVVGAVATVVGLGLALTSIAFTNKANDYKREARKMKLKTSAENINIPGFKNSMANTSRQYKLSLVIPLGR